MAVFLLGSFGLLGNAVSIIPTTVEDFAYPRIALAAQISGAVNLILRIDKSGEVKEVLKSQGAPILVAAAIKNVRAWKFSRFPCYKDPYRLPSETQVHYIFKLEGISSAPPTSHCTYKFPNTMVIVSAAPHWQP